MNPLARSLSALLVLLAASSPARAQVAKFHFDPVRDLPGYQAVLDSLDKALYPLDSFDALLGNEMTPAQLAAEQKRWESERGAVDTKLAELAADPRAAFLFRLEHRLARHEYFSKIGWTVEEAPAPFVMFVQRPSKDDPKYAANVVELYKPWLASLSSAFDARVAEPARAKPNAALGAVALAVLATPGDYQTAGRLLDADVGSVNGGIHDAALRIDVGHGDPFGAAKGARDRVRPLVTVAALGLLQRHQANARVPGSVLITRGVPDYLFESLGDGTAIVDVPKPRADALLDAMSVLGDARKRVEFAVRLPELLAVIDGPGAVGLGDRQARKFGAKQLSDRRGFWSSFDRQCALWTHYLIDGDGGAQRVRWTKYVQEVLAGKSGPDAAKIAFEGADLVAIERAFWHWVVATTKTYFPTTEVPSADAIEDLLAGPPPAIAVAPAPAAATPVAAAVEHPLNPKVLAVQDTDMEARIGMQLVRARANDLDGALAGLRELAAAHPVDPYAGRVDREIARVAAIVDLRDKWLAALVQKQGRLEIELDGKKVNLPIRGVANGAIAIAANKSGITSLALADLPLSDLLSGTERREYQAGFDPWVRGYLAVMTGDAKADKFAKGDEPQVRDVREDLRVWIGESVRTGKAAVLLNEIAALPLPNSRTEGESALERARVLLAERDLPSVVVRRESLVRYARASLAAIAAGMDAREFVHGKWETVADGSVRLTYEFDRPEEIADFAKHVGYLPDLRKKYGPLLRSEAEAKVESVDGRAVFIGPSCWRLPIGFQAPFQVRYTLRVVHVEGELAAGPTFDVLTCDDTKGTFVRATAFGWIWVNDRVTNRQAEASPTGDMSYLQDTDYDVEVAHDGTRITTRFVGETRATCATGAVTAGDVVLWVHSDLPVSAARFEITGRVDPKSLDRARARWVERRISELGL